MTTILNRAARVALDLLYPPQCALCGTGGTLLCGACAGTLAPADGDRCPLCWIPSRREGVCAHCEASPPGFASLRAAFVMEGATRRLVHELKYEGMTSLAGVMAALLMERLDPLPAADVVVPVPLHRSRERARGYNQAAELARHVAAALGAPHDTRAVRRIRNTAPLTKTMHRADRLAIMGGAFAAKAARVEGRRVLLLDDVATTGATLDACARALVEAGAARVDCVTWARAD